MTCNKDLWTLRLCSIRLNHSSIGAPLMVYLVIFSTHKGVNPSVYLKFSNSSNAEIPGFHWTEMTVTCTVYKS